MRLGHGLGLSLERDSRASALFDLYPEMKAEELESYNSLWCLENFGGHDTQDIGHPVTQDIGIGYIYRRVGVVFSFVDR